MHDCYWNHYTPEELETKIKNHPVTERELQMMASDNHIKVSFIIFENPNSKGLVMYCGCTAGIPKYHVMLNKLSSNDECMATFAHELIHIYYRSGGTYIDNDETRLAIDKLIEREAIAAATKYPLLIESILKSCPSNGCS